MTGYGSYTFVVMPAAGGCTWTVSTTDAWINFVGPTSGTGSAPVSFYALQNVPPTAPRLGSILVAWAGGGTRFTVNQAGVYCVPSQTYQIPASARVEVWWLPLGLGCFVNTTMAIDVSWLHVPPLSPTTAGGDLLNLFIDPNPGAPRTGHITMSGTNGNGLYAQYTFVQAGQ
jgi:Putative binding domain, N-terminal